MENTALSRNLHLSGCSCGRCKSDLFLGALGIICANQKRRWQTAINQSAVGCPAKAGRVKSTVRVMDLYLQVHGSGRAALLVAAPTRSSMPNCMPAQHRHGTHGTEILRRCITLNSTKQYNQKIIVPAEAVR